jgi:hypothetical protein
MFGTELPEGTGDFPLQDNLPGCISKYAEKQRYSETLRKNEENDANRIPEPNQGAPTGQYCCHGDEHFGMFCRL